MSINKVFDQRPYTGAIFCGGKSQRMGVDKSGIVLGNGKTLIEYVYAVLRKVCKDIVLVGHAKGVPESMSHLKVIKDNHLECGPLGGMEALLASGIDRAYLVVSCDLDQLGVELLQCLSESEYSSAVVRTKDNLHPLVGIYSEDQLASVQNRLKNNKLSMHGLIEANKMAIIDLPQNLEKQLHNVNKITDLKIEHK
ncbi:MAG: molybdopterin-guanine dinucleotide biosynthesis protein A [Candidatus Omnitrophota bacterium]|jgi:molybdopterin-guanine dinucleotide biosynthesis protein A